MVRHLQKHSAARGIIHSAGPLQAPLRNQRLLGETRVAGYLRSR